MEEYNVNETVEEIAEEVVVEAAPDITDIKSALAALCAEVSQLKNKLELVMGLLEK